MIRLFDNKLIMTRTQPTTIWTDRTRPTTDWKKPRSESTFTCDTTSFTCDTTSFTCDKTLNEEIATSWGTPRKVAFLELENLSNITLENLEFLWTEWGTKSNIIDTIWT